MKVILDVNILLSALIRDSTTRDIIIHSGLNFYFPEPSLQKIRKYQEYIIEKSCLTKIEYFMVLRTLFKFIKIIPTEEVLKSWDEAKEIMERVDPEDVMFIAAALSQDNSIIWSEDKDFERQDKIIILKTKDIINFSKKL